MSNKAINYLSEQTGERYTNMDLLNTALVMTNKTANADFKPLRKTLQINHNNLPMEKITEFQNEIFKNLVNRIGMVVAKGLHFNNPLGIFKTEDMTLGDIIEEYYVHEAEEGSYDGKSSDHPYKYYDTDLTVFFHDGGRESKWSRSIEERWTRKAFASEKAFDDFIDKMILSLVASDEIREYELTKDLVTRSLSPITYKGKTIRNPHTIIDNTQDGYIEELNKMIIKRSGYFRVPSTVRFENGIQRANSTPVEEQVLLIDIDHATEIDTLLAMAYHNQKITPITNVVVVDQFPTYNGEDELKGYRPICALVSKGSINLTDTMYKMTGVYDESNLKYNIFLHHHQKAWFSVIENAHIFVVKD